MSVNNIASLSTAMAAAKTDTDVSMTMLKKTMDAASSSASELLSALPSPTPSSNLPSNLGQNINTVA